jgi:hypothetical protein
MGETKNRIHNKDRRSKTTNSSFGGCKEAVDKVEVDKFKVDNREVGDSREVVDKRKAVEKMVVGNEGLPQTYGPCNKEEEGNKEEEEEEVALSC